jgi:hypothetical protein
MTDDWFRSVDVSFLFKVMYYYNVHLNELFHMYLVISNELKEKLTILYGIGIDI